MNITELSKMSQEIHATAKEKGWHDENLSPEVKTAKGQGAQVCFSHLTLSTLLEDVRKTGAVFEFGNANIVLDLSEDKIAKLSELALIHSEVSEAAANIIDDEIASDHIPEFSGLEEELADVVIRIADFTEKRKLKTWEAMQAKIEYNKSRPHKHGGKLI